MCRDSNLKALDSPIAGESPLFFPLLLMFGTVYFVQGIIEPTACLPAQPIQTQLRTWHFSADQIGRFFGVIGIAWSVKPLFGLVSDFLPIVGRRRLPYLLLSTRTAGLAFLGLAAVWHPTSPDAGTWFRWLIGLTPAQAGVGQIGWLLVVAGF